MHSNVFVCYRKTDHLTFQGCLRRTNRMGLFPDRRSKDFGNVANTQSTNVAANLVFSLWNVCRFQTAEGRLAEKRSAAKTRYADTLITLKLVSVSVGSVGRCVQGVCCRQRCVCACVSIHNADTLVHSHMCH